MHSLKRLLATLFLCGLLVPNCYAGAESGPPNPNTPAPDISEPASTPGGSAPAGGGDSGGPSDPGTCAN